MRYRRSFNEGTSDPIHTGIYGTAVAIRIGNPDGGSGTRTAVLTAKDARQIAYELLSLAERVPGTSESV